MKWLLRQCATTTARSGDSGKGHAPPCPPKTAVLTPLPIYQNAPLDEISVYQVIPQTAFFGPDPLPDPQIGLSCHQLEKFPPAAQQGAPAGHSRVHQHWAAFAAIPSAVNAPPRPSPPTPKFLKPAARPKRRKKRSSQQKTQEGSCGALLVLRSSIEPASERPTCSRTRAPISDSRRSAQREAQQSTKRSTAKHGVISGGEQARVRTSCRHLGIELRIASAARYQNFPPAALRSCARGA